MARGKVTFRTSDFAMGELVPAPPAALPAAVGELVEFELCRVLLAAQRRRARTQDVRATLRALAALGADERRLREAWHRLDNDSMVALTRACYQLFHRLPNEATPAQLVTAAAAAQRSIDGDARNGRPAYPDTLYTLIRRAAQIAPRGQKQRYVRKTLGALGIVLSDRQLAALMQRARQTSDG